MSLGSRRALLASAGGGKGLGDEQWYMLDKVDVTGNTTALVSFTSSGSDDSWANYKHLVFIAAISTHVYSDNKVNIYVNNYNHRTTTSYRPYYNLRLSNMVSGSSHNMEYSNLNSGTGDQYASQGPCMGNGLGYQQSQLHKVLYLRLFPVQANGWHKSGLAWKDRRTCLSWAGLRLHSGHYSG